MAKPMKSIDITNRPDLVDVVEEVRATGEPRLLRRNDEAVAIITPIAPARTRPPKAPAGQRLKPKKMTEADLAAFHSAAGSWKDVDTDKLIEDIYAARNVQRTPPEY